MFGSRTLSSLGLALTLIGCAETAEYRNFADVGARYSAIMPVLLDKACLAQVDASSWSLAMDRIDNAAPLSDSQMDRLDTADRERCETLAALKQHAVLLKQYFGQLEKLSRSDVDERLGDTISQTFEDMAAVGSQLSGGPIAFNAPAIADISGVIVRAEINRQLRAELNRRKNTLRSELALQETLLSALALQIGHAEALSRDARAQLMVQDTLTRNRSFDAAAVPALIDARRQMIVGVPAPAKLSEAADTARKLREAFRDLVSAPGLTSQQMIDRIAELGQEVGALHEAVSDL